MYKDLSVLLVEKTPVYPGDPTTSIKPAGVLTKDGFNDHYVSVGTHVGTHIDAPLHMLPGGKTLNQYPIENFIGRGKLVIVKDKFDLEALKQADIKQDDIVLFRTGMSSRYFDPAYFENYPAMNKEIARYLVECKVKMVGVDACSVDSPDNFPTHKILLANDVLIIENLTNLDELIGKEFTVTALPIKFELDAAPARVVAQLL